MAKWKTITLHVLWILFGIATLVLFGAAAIKKGGKTCSAIEVNITGTADHVFADEKDITALLNSAGAYEGQQIGTINLRKIEEALEKNAWIENAELFFDNNQILHVNIAEREPIARIFSAGGSSWYIDSTGLRLPLSDKIIARVPVFTGFPSDNELLSAPDSVVLKNITEMGNIIYADSFWNAQVSQINITPEGEYELIPVIGNHIVVLGSADNIKNKLDRLYSYYKNIAVKTGFDRYSKLDVQYNGQVVAVKKGVAVANVDSTDFKADMEQLINRSTTSISDSTQQRNAENRQQQNVPKAVLPGKKN